MAQLKSDDILFVYSDDFGPDSGLFFLSVGEVSNRALTAHIHHCGKFYAPDTSRQFLAADRAVMNFIRKFERECNWPKYAVRYHWRWLEELTDPCSINPRDLRDIYATASRVVKAGTTNNMSLAKLVKDVSNTRLKEIEENE